MQTPDYKRSFRRLSLIFAAFAIALAVISVPGATAKPRPLHLSAARVYTANASLVTQLCNPFEGCTEGVAEHCDRLSPLEMSCEAGLIYSDPSDTCEWRNLYYIEPGDPELRLDFHAPEGLIERCA